MSARKHLNADLRIHYVLRVEAGLILVLLFLIVGARIHVPTGGPSTPPNRPSRSVYVPLNTAPPSTFRSVPDDTPIPDSSYHFDASLDVAHPVLLLVHDSSAADVGRRSILAVEEPPELIGGLESVARLLVYPEAARKAHVEGLVLVEFTVNEQGRVVAPNVVRGLGAGCDEAAIQAIKAARFIPAKRQGHPVAVKMSLPVTYRIR